MRKMEKILSDTGFWFIDYLLKESILTNSIGPDEAFLQK